MPSTIRKESSRRSKNLGIIANSVSRMKVKVCTYYYYYENSFVKLTSFISAYIYIYIYIYIIYMHTAIIDRFALLIQKICRTVSN